MKKELSEHSIRNTKLTHGGQEGFTVEATLVLNLEAYLSDFERLNVLRARK